MCVDFANIHHFGEGNGNPLQYSYLEKSCGWSSLVGYSPWGFGVGHDLTTIQQQQ